MTAKHSRQHQRPPARAHRHRAAAAPPVRRRRRLLTGFGAALLAIASVTIGTQSAGAAQVGAFPGAEGYGSSTPGGRGGRVIEVTNLNDSGTGSLREALTASGPRIVVFRVGGTITLKTVIKVKNPYLTVAGQTAPGGGILLRNDPARTTDVATLRIQTNDVIVRGLRFRPGAPGAQGIQGDALTIESSSTTKARRIIVDHNSFSWATDEVVSSYLDTQDITFSYNIVSEGLSHSTHELGEHSRGLFGSGDYSYNISMHHNLMAHNVERNPEVSTTGYSDVRNNVVYDWGKWATTITDKRQGKTNVVNNWYKAGPSKSTTRPDVDFYASSGKGMTVYVAGNRRADGSAATVSSGFTPYMSSTPLPTAPVTTTSASQAYLDVMANAGARVPAIDDVDKRILADVRNGTGKLIDSPSQVGGWPTIAGGTAPADSDHDGMPNTWESERGLNPGVNDSAGDRNGDGWTNVEEYVNGLIQVPGTSSTSTTTQTTASTASPTPTASPSPTTTSYPAPGGLQLVCPVVSAPKPGDQVVCTYR